MFRSACTPYLLHKHVRLRDWQHNKALFLGAKRRKLIFTYKNRFFLLQTVFSLKNNASKFQFILRHETVFVQINICVNNCIEVIDASVLSSDNSQLKLTTIGHRTGPHSLSELLRLACTLNPRRQFVPLLCDSFLIIKK